MKPGHRQPELAKRHARGTQVRAERQTVGASAHNRNVDRIFNETKESGKKFPDSAAMIRKHRDG